MRARALLVLLAAAGCDADFTPQYRVTDLRVLSIRAEVAGSQAPTLADADLGEVLRLEALVANPRGLPGVRVDWYACLPREGETVPPCLDPDALRDPDRLVARPGVVALGSGERIEVAVPPQLQPAVEAVVSDALARPELACSLYAELPILALARAEGSPVRAAVKAARVAPEASLAGGALAGVYVRNANPTIAQVRAEPVGSGGCATGLTLVRPCGSAAECGGVACTSGVLAGPAAPASACEDPLPRETRDLCAFTTSRSTQVFAQCDPDGARFSVEEDLTWQWYVSGGSFDDEDGFDIGNATGSRQTLTPPAGPFTLWVIVRDGRGGEDWLRRDFR